MSDNTFAQSANRWRGKCTMKDCIDPVACQKSGKCLNVKLFEDIPIQSMLKLTRENAMLWGALDTLIRYLAGRPDYDCFCGPDAEHYARARAALTKYRGGE